MMIRQIVLRAVVIGVVSFCAATGGECKEAGRAERPEERFQRVELGHSQASDVVKLVKQLVRTVKFVPDEKTNSVFVVGREGVDRAIEVVKLLDVTLGVPIQKAKERKQIPTLARVDVGVFEVEAAAVTRLGIPSPADIQGEAGEKELAERLLSIREKGVVHLVDLSYSMVLGKAMEFTSRREAPFSTTTMSSGVTQSSLGGYAEANVDLVLTASQVGAKLIRVDTRYNISSFDGESQKSLPPPRSGSTGQFSAFLGEGKVTVFGGRVDGGGKRRYLYWVLKGRLVTGE